MQGDREQGESGGHGGLVKVFGLDPEGSRESSKHFSGFHEDERGCRRRMDQMT